MVYDEHRFDTSTAPNEGLQDGVKSGAEYHSERLGFSWGLEFVGRQTPGFRPGIVEGLI